MIFQHRVCAVDHFPVTLCTICIFTRSSHKTNAPGTHKSYTYHDQYNHCSSFVSQFFNASSVTIDALYLPPSPLSHVQCPASMLHTAALCLSIHPSQAGTALKKTNRSSSFLVQRLPFVCTTSCWMEILISPKIGEFPLDLCHELWTRKNSAMA